MTRASFTIVPVSPARWPFLEGGGHDLSDFVVDTPLHSP
jgi:hypothetical protein